jgi:hypothetical protein
MGFRISDCDHYGGTRDFGWNTPRSYGGGGYAHTSSNGGFSYKNTLMNGVMVISTLARCIYGYWMP